MRDHDTNRDEREAPPNRDTQRPESRIHRVCVTCNNMFETNIDHIDTKYCPTCRRA